MYFFRLCFLPMDPFKVLHTGPLKVKQHHTFAVYFVDICTSVIPIFLQFYIYKYVNLLSEHVLSNLST